MMGKIRKLAATVLCGTLFLTEPGIVYALPDAQAAPDSIQGAEDKTEAADSTYEENTSEEDTDGEAGPEDSVPDETLEESAAEENETDPEEGEENGSVLLNEGEDGLPGGTVEIGGQITWQIDADGMLTVEGTGDFQERGKSDQWFQAQTPWYPYREQILSAKVNVTGLTNANGLFDGCMNLTNADLSSLDTSQVTDMAFMFGGCEKLSNVDVSHFDTSQVTTMSFMFCSCMSLPGIDVSGFDTSRVVNMSYMFASCWELADVDVSGFDTSQVANMSFMFSDCKKLPRADVSHFDTGCVTNMSSMFMGCQSLESVDVSGFDTSQAEYMGCMFDDCEKLTALNLKGFDTGKVLIMNGMFSGCKSLSSLDVSSFDVSRVENLSTMFFNCSGLKTLDVGHFDTRKVENMSGMFSGCSGLKELDVSSFNTGRVKDMSFMFYGCQSLAKLDVSNFNTDCLTKINNIFDYCINLTELDLSGFDLGNVRTKDDMEPMFTDCTSLSRIRTPINQKYNAVHAPSPGYDKDGVYNSSVPWYWENSGEYPTFYLPQDFDYSVLMCRPERPSVKYPYITVRKTNPFYRCGEALTLDDLTVTYYASLGNAQKVTAYSTNAAQIDMSAPGKKTLTVTYNNMTANVVLTVGSLTKTGGEEDGEIAKGSVNEDYGKIEWVIDGAGKLTVTGTGNVRNSAVYGAQEIPWYSYRSKILSARIAVTGMTDASDLFYECKYMTSVDLSSFDTRFVSNMSRMFYNCRSLVNLDLSSLDTGRVTSMSEMFCYCNNLETLNVSQFDTGNVEYMNEMFDSCTRLRAIDPGSFDTGKVVAMYAMFRRCSSLEQLDLSHFNTSRVTSMSEMFSYCERLKSLNISNFDTGSVESTEKMFNGCLWLTELDLSSFDVSKAGNMTDMFLDCESMTRIWTPRNVKEGMSVRLPMVPSAVWYNSASSYAILPENLEYSILVYRYGKPDISYPYIIAQKTKTLYVCNERLNLDDLWVVYYAEENNASEITEYSTNADEIDMSIPGEKELKITCKGCETVLALKVMKRSWGTENGYAGGKIEETYGRIEWEIDKEGKLTVYGTGDVSKYTNKGRAPWYPHRDRILSAEIRVEGMTDASYLFFGCENMTKADVSGFDTSQVKNMSCMFCECRNLSELDVSGFDTGQVTDMSEMFYNCYRLPGLDVSGFDTGQVTNMSEMFYCCLAVVKLDVSGFDTGRVTNMSEMFFGCAVLPELDVSGFDTSHVTDMSWMFSYCRELTELDVSGFDTSQATDTTWMFCGCSKLSKLDLSHFDLGKAKDAYEMFLECDALLEIKTPVNVQDTVDLPAGEGDVWYQEGEGKLTVTELPQNLNYSVLLCKNKVPDEIPGSYTVTFDLQGHGVLPEEYASYPKIVSGELLPKRSDPSADGYIFTGWYKEAACENLWDFDKDTVTEDITLYAGWKQAEDTDPDKVTYTVTFDLQGHGTLPAEYVPYLSVKDQELIKEPAVPTADGYLFKGWYKEPACEIPWDFALDIVKNNMTLYACWVTDPGELGDVWEQDVPTDGIPDGIWIAKIKNYSYTGKAICPDVHVYWGRERLDQGLDYTIQYKNNIQADVENATMKIPTVTVKLKKHCPTPRVLTENFHILPVDLNDVTVDDFTVAWNKKIQKKIPTLTWNGKKLENKKDFKAAFPDTSAGAYQNPGAVYPVELSKGTSGNFTGTRTVYLTVTDKILITKASVKKIPAQDYKGTAQEPELDVTYRKKPLVKGTDYEVTWKDNVEIGTATAYVAGKGAYAGTKKVTFKIAGVSLKGARVEGLTKQKTYNGMPQVQEFSVTTKDGQRLTEGIDYTAIYANNKNVGKATLTITGIGACTGTIKKTFRITTYDLALDPDRQIKGLEADTVYEAVYIQGGKSRPDLKLTFNGRRLIENRDYTLSCKNNKDVTWEETKKRPEATIKGKGNFKGKVTREFIIKF